MGVPGFAALLFVAALLHTFATPWCARRAARATRHAGIWHLLAEVEVAFGVWAAVLIAVWAALQGPAAALAYLDGRSFVEPLFVFAMMVVAGSRPVRAAAEAILAAVTRFLPGHAAVATYWLLLGVAPLLGSLITEPAAMTLAALLLHAQFLSQPVPERFRYLTVATLFVNVSIGGVLTPYAAPPVVMVAAAWGWGMPAMLHQFGLAAAGAVAVNATIATLLYRDVLQRLASAAAASAKVPRVPAPLVAIHLLLLAGLVLCAHHPAAFVGLLLLFLGLAAAYPRHQDALLLREGLLVALFLGGLVVLGGMQSWWLAPLLGQMGDAGVFWGATALTAVTDNAAITYLASQVDGLSPEFKRALVAGAVTGGGLTVIANAPNPAGLAIVRASFRDGAVSAVRLFAYALAPTAVAAAAFLLR